MYNLTLFVRPIKSVWLLNSRENLFSRFKSIVICCPGGGTEIPSFIPPVESGVRYTRQSYPITGIADQTTGW